MIRNSTILKRVKFYSATAILLMTLGELRADIVYTDVDPDVTKGTNSTYEVDFNNDGTVDITINQLSGGGFGDRIFASSSTNAHFAGIADQNMASRLSYGDPINPSGSFTSTTTGQMASTGTTTPEVYAWYGGATDKYIGASFIIDNSIHYGWVQLDVAADLLSFTVKSYAYESIPGMGILAGYTAYTPTEAVTAVSAADNADNSNASDIKVSFTKASSETGIGKYRVFVVPAADAASFSLADAQEVSGDSYYDVTPTGSDMMFSLPQTLMSTEGQDIVSGVEYKVFVMSVGQEGYSNAISSASETFTLSTATATHHGTIIDPVDLYISDNDLIIEEMPSNGIVEVFDMNGVRLLTGNLMQGRNQYDLSGIRNALIVYIHSEGKYQSKKFIKD